MSRSMRLLLVLSVFSIVAAACGAGDDGGSVPTDAVVAPDADAADVEVPASDAPLDDTDEPPTTAGEAGPEDPAAPSDSQSLPQLDGPPAPDFSFALGDGSTFVMSEATKPVYLVFWAEW